MPPPRTEEPTGGPMKIIAIFLAILCASLGYFLFKQSGTATTAVGAVMKSRDTFSNQVDVLNTKLMEEHGTGAFTRSNLQYALDRRTVEAHFFSNRVVQTILRLNDAQSEARNAQVDAQTEAATAAVLEAQKQEMTRNLEVIPRLQKDLVESKVQLGRVSRERDELALELGRMRVDMAETERLLDDPELLRAQVKKAEDAAKVRKAAASGQRVRITDAWMQLELQPDGTVRPIAATTSGTKK